MPLLHLCRRIFVDAHFIGHCKQSLKICHREKDMCRILRYFCGGMCRGSEFGPTTAWENMPNGPAGICCGVPAHYENYWPTPNAMWNAHDVLEMSAEASDCHARNQCIVMTAYDQKQQMHREENLMSILVLLHSTWRPQFFNLIRHPEQKSVRTLGLRP